MEMHSAWYIIESGIAESENREPLLDLLRLKFEKRKKKKDLMNGGKSRAQKPVLHVSLRGTRRVIRFTLQRVAKLCGPVMKPLSLLETSPKLTAFEGLISVAPE